MSGLDVLIVPNVNLTMRNRKHAWMRRRRYAHHRGTGLAVQLRLLVKNVSVGQITVGTGLHARGLGIVVREILFLSLVPLKITFAHRLGNFL